MKQYFAGFFLWCLLSFAAIYSSDSAYAFSGSHFIASYTGCSHSALTDLPALKKAFIAAVGECGATILDSCDYTFAPDGLTMVILLSESHASIHTYPEHDACFIDLFTCGDKCSSEKFDAALQTFLQPKNVCKKNLARCSNTCLQNGDKD
jgi:S-adenosylmethionine decarboxylase